MKPVCLVLGHRRSRGKAVEDSHFGWRSVCERCGMPMVRLGHQKWVPERDAPARPSAPSSEDAPAT